LALPEQGAQVKGLYTRYMSLNTNMADGTVATVVLSVSLVFINLSTVIFVQAVKNCEM